MQAELHPVARALLAKCTPWPPGQILKIWFAVVIKICARVTTMCYDQVHVLYFITFYRCIITQPKTLGVIYSMLRFLASASSAAAPTDKLA